jgi:hypothetical protein
VHFVTERNLSDLFLTMILLVGVWVSYLLLSVVHVSGVYITA